MNGKNVVNGLPFRYKMLAVLLSVLMIISVMPFNTFVYATEENTQKLFKFINKNEGAIENVEVKLFEPNNEEEIISATSNYEGFVEFDTSKLDADINYTYKIFAVGYDGVTDGTLNIGNVKSPIVIKLYAAAPQGSINTNDSTVTFGDNFKLNVNVSGVGNLKYEWYKNETLIGSYFASSELYFSSINFNDTGKYTCVVTSDLSDKDVSSKFTANIVVTRRRSKVQLLTNPVSGHLYSETGVQLTANVSDYRNVFHRIPSGDILFLVNNSPVGKVKLENGSANLTGVILTSDKIHSISAEYLPGDGEIYEKSNSETICYEVGKITPKEIVDYEKNIPNGKDGWYKEGGLLEITPKGMFDKIREGETGEWQDVLKKGEETAKTGNDVTFYLLNSETGEVSNPKTVKYKLDKTPTTNNNAQQELNYKSDWKCKYEGDINGGGRRNINNYLYYVKLTASDELSGVAYFQWKYRDSETWSENITAKNGTAQILVNYKKWDRNHGIDIIVCDNAGNLSDIISVPAQNSLDVDYEVDNIQRYVNKNNQDVTEDEFDDDTRVIHNKPVTVTLSATSENFDETAISASVNGLPLNLTWVFDGTNYVSTITLNEGDSIIKISAKTYNIGSSKIGGKVAYEEYISNVHSVDTIKPVIDIAFDPSPRELKTDREMTVSIIDKNFRADELYFSALTAKDIQGNDVAEFDADAFLTQLKNATWVTDGDVHTAKIIFSVEAIYNFTLEYKDLANNAAQPYAPDSFAIDKTSPSNLKIAYVSDPISTFLQVVSFGYYNPSVTIQMYADDSITGVDHFNWTYIQEDGTSTTSNVPVESGEITNLNPDDFAYTNKQKTAVATLTLTADEFAQYRGSFSFTATDKVGQTSDVHYGDGKAIDENGNIYDTSSGHIVVVDTIAPTRAVTYLEPQKIRNKETLEAFDGDKSVYVNQENINSIIYYDNTYGGSVPVTLKIVEANFYAEDVEVKVNDTVYSVADWTQNGDEWTSTIRLIDDGAYVITVSYIDRSGNVMLPYQSEQIVIDRVSPVIDKYEFLPTTVDGDVGTQEFITILEYGFYFKTDFKVEIHTSDAAPSSGLDSIKYYLIPYNDGTMQEEINGILPVADGVAELIVPAGFKGQIYAESNDNAGNKSDIITTQAYIIDEVAPTISVVNNGTTTYRDALGNPLYVNDVSVTVTITDTVSGIKEIGYSQSSEKAATPRKSITVNNVGYSIGDNLGDGWIVSEMDVNLVTKVTKTFVYNNDDNDIILTFDSADRSSNRIEAVNSETFTLDKTEPIINVAFRADDDTDLYYDENRIADITVIERNFDASLIRAAIENRYGSVPGYSFTQVSNSEYRAVIDFDEGDYTFTITGTDLGNHTAIVNYSGGNENLFYVDKTKPVVNDNFIEFSNSAAQNSFNADKTVSISITEHNFDPNLVRLRVLRKAAGSIHNSSALSDVTSEFVGGRSWNTSGDVHRISFIISADAVYQIEMSPSDLAGNTADYRSTVVFEIDKTVPTVSARNGNSVGENDVEFLDMYTHDRKDEPAPTVEFSDLNMDHIKYSLIVWTPDYSNSEALPTVKAEKKYLDGDILKEGIIRDAKFTLPNFIKDGVYALELIAVDVAGNESLLNVNTYAKLIDRDVLAFILNSNVENKTGLYSFQYEDGTPMSMRPDNFSDLNILVMAKKDSSVDIVLRDANAEEIHTNAQATVDESVFGFKIYNFVLKSDFFKDNFSGDTDMDLHLTVKNDEQRIDLGKIRIDNTSPLSELPKEFKSWHWYFGEESRTITISNINELLDERNCKVYDNGEEIAFVYSSEHNTISFTLEKGWHSVGIVLRDMAGNETNIQEKVNIHIGYFWLWIIISSSLVAISIIVFIIIRNNKKKKALENQ